MHAVLVPPHFVLQLVVPEEQLHALQCFPDGLSFGAFNYGLVPRFDEIDPLLVLRADVEEPVLGSLRLVGRRLLRRAIPRRVGATVAPRVGLARVGEDDARQLLPHAIVARGHVGLVEVAPARRGLARVLQSRRRPGRAGWRTRRRPGRAPRAARGPATGGGRRVVGAAGLVVVGAARQRHARGADQREAAQVGVQHCAELFSSYSTQVTIFQLVSGYSPRMYASSCASSPTHRARVFASRPGDRAVLHGVFKRPLRSASLLELIVDHPLLHWQCLVPIFVPPAAADSPPAGRKVQQSSFPSSSQGERISRGATTSQRTAASRGSERHS